MPSGQATPESRRCRGIQCNVTWIVHLRLPACEHRVRSAGGFGPGLAPTSPVGHVVYLLQDLCQPRGTPPAFPPGHLPCYPSAPCDHLRPLPAPPPVLQEGGSETFVKRTLSSLSVARGAVDPPPPPSSLPSLTFPTAPVLPPCISAFVRRRGLSERCLHSGYLWRSQQRLCSSPYIPASKQGDTSHLVQSRYLSSEMCSTSLRSTSVASSGSLLHGRCRSQG